MKLDSSLTLYTKILESVIGVYLHNTQGNISSVVLKKVLTIKENIKNLPGKIGTIKKVKLQSSKKIFELILSDSGLLSEC